MKNLSKLALLVGLLWLPQFAIAEDLPPKQQLDSLLKQHQGKVVYLDFWASWCAPCRQSFPWMQQMTSQYSRDDFVVISVNVDAERNLAETFLDQQTASFAVIYDPEAELASTFQLKGMPSSYIYDREGKLVKSHVGFFPRKIAQYENEIVELITQSQLVKN